MLFIYLFNFNQGLVKIDALHFSRLLKKIEAIISCNYEKYDIKKSTKYYKY